MDVYVNGVLFNDYIAYGTLTWNGYAIDGPNAGRNMAGNMVFDPVTDKERLEFTCRPLTEDEAYIVFNAVKPRTFTVLYKSPADISAVGRTMYRGNRVAKHLMKKHGKDWWTGIVMQLIEV